MTVPFNVAGRETGRDLPGGLVVPDLSLVPQWVRITGRLSGRNRYAYRQIDDGSYPDFAEDLADGFGSTGTTHATKGYTAYELQGRDDVPIGEIVQVWPAGNLSYQVFKFEGEGDGGDPDGESDSADDGGGSLSGSDSDDTDDDVTVGPIGNYCDTGCGSLAGLRPDWLLAVDVVCAAGEFRAMDVMQYVTLAHDGQGIWTSTEEIDWVGGSGVVEFYFDSGRPVLTLAGLPLALQCFGRDATFSGGWMTGHTGDGDQVPRPCQPNDFSLRVSCVEADPGGSSVSGGTGGGGNGGNVVQSGCCVDPVPEIMNWVITNKVGVCACAPDSGTVTHDAGFGPWDRWSSVLFYCLQTECEANAEYHLDCGGGSWAFGGHAPTSITCPEDGPFEVVFDVSPTLGGSYRITFTEA